VQRLHFGFEVFRGIAKKSEKKVKKKKRKNVTKLGASHLIARARSSRLPFWVSCEEHNGVMSMLGGG